MFASCAMALAAFDISKVVENGIEVTPEVAYTTGTIRYVFRLVPGRRRG